MKINVDDIVSMMGGSFSILKEVSELLFHDANKRIYDIKRLAKEKNFSEAAKIAHSLKGCVNNLGISKINENSLTIESMLKEEKYPKKQLKSLKSMLKVVESKITNEINRRDLVS